MKEEGNIAMGLLTANKWQPSVLQLLPFSNNNVGVKRNTHGVPSANYRYLENGPDREFPMLAVTRLEKARPRSKSANIPSEASTTSQAGGGERRPDKGQKHRLFRASSERLARGAERTSTGAASAKHRTKLRARSDYGISTLYKRPEVVKISVNDINEQILGRNRVRSAVSWDDGAGSKACEPPNGARLKQEEEGGEELREARKEGDRGTKGPSPKSALKQTQGRWPNSGITFWSSAATAPSTSSNARSTPRINHRTRGGDIDTNGLRETSTAPAEVYFRRDGRRVKLNVNELPRSKTPIADNDPDKLNMQHVIAFLQSSSNADDDCDKREAEASGVRVKSGLLTHSPVKRSAINGVITASPDKNGLVSIRPSHAPTRTGAVSPGKALRFPADNEIEITPHRLSFNKANSQADEQKDRVLLDTSNSSHSKSGTESMELYRKTRTTLNNQGGILQYSDFKTHSVNLSEKTNPVSSGYPNLEEVHIPLSIRKIRDNRHSGEARPFRLHRFLTLVSNGPGSPIDAPEKCERSAGGAGQSKNMAARDKRRAFLKGSIKEKGEKRHVRQHKYHPDSNLYYLDVSSPFNDRPWSKGESRASSVIRQEEMEAEQLRKDVQRVIRLPRAHFEADSDEEGSPYCTVPAARNKRALTLSAQGKAIRNIISGYSSKPSVTQQHTEGPPAQKGNKPKDSPINPEEVSASPSDTAAALKQASPECVEEKAVNPEEVQSSYQKEPDPVPQEEIDRIGESELLAVKKPEMTPDQVSAVTFKDMLDLRSDPGVNSYKKDSTGATSESGSAGTIFLTQALPSSSSPQSEKQRLSPININQQKNPATGGSPLSKRDGGASSSLTNGSSPSPNRDHVKLSLRKEKNKTRELTYMFQVDYDGIESFRPSPKYELF